MVYSSNVFRTVLGLHWALRIVGCSAAYYLYARLWGFSLPLALLFGVCLSYLCVCRSGLTAKRVLFCFSLCLVLSLWVVGVISVVSLFSGRSPILPSPAEVRENQAHRGQVRKEQRKEGRKTGRLDGSFGDSTFLFHAVVFSLSSVRVQTIYLGLVWDILSRSRRSRTSNISRSRSYR